MQWYLVLICEVNLYASAHCHLHPYVTNTQLYLWKMQGYATRFPVAVNFFLHFFCFVFFRSRSICQTTTYARNTEHTVSETLLKRRRITDNSDRIKLNCNQCSSQHSTFCSDYVFNYSVILYVDWIYYILHCSLYKIHFCLYSFGKRIQSPMMLFFDFLLYNLSLNGMLCHSPINSHSQCELCCMKILWAHFWGYENNDRPSKW